MKIATLVALLTLSCAPSLPKCGTEESINCDSCVAELTETFIIDDRFTPSQDESIRNGGAMWNAATSGRVAFSFMSGSMDDTNESWARVVKVKDVLPPGLVGYTRKPVIELEVDQIVPANLSGIMAHELGHWLGLKHSKDPGSLMFAQVHDCMRVTKTDLEQFTERYGK